MRSRAYIGFLLAGVLFACSEASPAQTAQGAKSLPKERRQEAAHKYFTDVALVNQNGETLRFYSDLIKDKVVVINVFFTSCHGSCPPMILSMQKIQDHLGDRLGKEAHLISITVDPAIDTPALLKEYAQKFKARPGWHFITGRKEDVEFALAKLGQAVKAREDHTNIFIIGNESTGLWKKAFGLAKPEDLLKVVASVVTDKGEAAQ
ncbi:MAG TPA: SCO family protein [Blastocatellia bacterium]|nr:SCO family protein [Blastocatellia bacterium]